VKKGKKKRGKKEKGELEPFYSPLDA